MVEGTSDVAYMEMAARLYRTATGRELLSQDFSVFAAGNGDEGGTYGVSERFPSLFDLASLELDAGGNRRYRVIALLDDDPMGRVATAGIARSDRRIVEYESIFRLRRVLPLRAGSAKALAEKTKLANSSYGTLECTIEDLLPDSLCDQFIKSAPHSICKPPLKTGSGVHRYWTLQGKQGLLRFVSQQATIEDAEGIINALRALRSYVGLPPDGATP